MDGSEFVKGNGMVIRIATRDDADVLIGFNTAMALETERKTLDQDVVGPAVAAIFDDENKGFYVVAEEDGEICGGLLITYEWSDWRNAWWWWIQSVYIRSETRGRRIYSHLYDFVKARAKEAGDVYGIRLYVETENIHAQRVYEKVGMQRSPYLMYDETL
ncbi:MAG: GNAT family N-acetyltransferase [Pyrinomonadaceae bacterium]